MDLARQLEDLDRATNAFLREATVDDPARPPTYEVLFLILDAFGKDPIGYDAAVAEGELPSFIHAKLSTLRKSAACVTEILRKVLVPEPTYCVASYWDARAQRRHAVGRRRTGPANLARSLRSAYTFFVLTHRGEEKQNLATAVQFIARTRTVIRLAYVHAAEDDLPESMFRLTKEECDEILATSRMDELVARVLPDFDLPTMALRVESQMRNEQRPYGVEDERPVLEYLERFRGMDFAQHRAVLSRFGTYLRGRHISIHLQDTEMIFILATSILYNRYVCPAQYLYPIFVPLGADFSILTLGTDKPFGELAQLIVHRFAQSLFQGLLAIDREHHNALHKLQSLVERTAGQIHHNFRSPLTRASNCIQVLIDASQRVPLDDVATERVRAQANRAQERLWLAGLQLDAFVAMFDAAGTYNKSFINKGHGSAMGATDLAELLRRVTRAVSLDDGAPAAGWNVDAVPSEFWVKGQQEFWSAILLVLLQNAQEASRGAVVSVALRRSSDEYGVLEIVNESLSMLPEKLRSMERILQRRRDRMDVSYMGLDITAGQLEDHLGIDPQDIELRFDPDRKILTVRITRIQTVG